MEITRIINSINDKLAGETLMYSQLVNIIDTVVDDINTALNATFPVISEYVPEKYKDYPNYNVFPDRYIRTVLVTGVASKFYGIDEEGAEVAPLFDREYRQALFNMVRDYSLSIPEEYQNKNAGYLSEGCSCDTPIEWGQLTMM